MNYCQFVRNFIIENGDRNDPQPARFWMDLLNENQSMNKSNWSHSHIYNAIRFYPEIKKYVQIDKRPLRNFSRKPEPMQVKEKGGSLVKALKIIDILKTESMESQNQILLNVHEYLFG